MTTACATTLIELKRKVESRDARIGVVGMGYVGLPLALLFSGERFAVTGFDIEERKVSTLNAGDSYIKKDSALGDPGSTESGLPGYIRLL